MKRRALRAAAANILRILIPAAFFVYVFHVIRIEDVVSVLKGTHWSWFLTGCLCVLLPILLSSWRTRELLCAGDTKKLGRLWMVHAASSMIAGVLPFRTGELSYVYYLHRHCRTAVSEGTAVWMSFRFTEYVIGLVILFCLSAATLLSGPSPFFWTVTILVGGNLLMALLVIWKIDLFYAMLGRAARFLKDRMPFSWAGDVLISRVDAFLERMSKAFSENVSARLLVLSSAIVILRYLFVLAMVRSMGVSLSVGLAASLFVFLYAAKFVQSLGSFGSQEAGITAALMLAGMSQAEALPIAIGTHLLQWAPILGFGMVGYMGLKLSRPHA